MRSVVGLLASVIIAGCASGLPVAALENKTFYQYDQLGTTGGSASAEQPYHPLDGDGPGGRYVGVSILGGAARLSRPESWRIRRASLTPEHRFIEYVSPRAYLVAFYERVDSPGDSWAAVLGRYEGDAKARGAELIGQGVPVATHTTQGREYVVRRKVPGQRAAFVNTSRELLLRSEKRVALLEFVEDGADAPGLIATEMLRVLDSVEIR